ncbi:MAG: hypothetical protein C0605_12535 [Hyphomicrobiales bacterium]|nr:MAG: hypothetical protein C0605_12535 [Hyphomicrobiales bacterium]
MQSLSVIQQHVDLVQSFGSLYLGVLAMGFFYGLTLCSLSCLPIVAPYIFGTQSGFRGGFDAAAVFIGARILTYGAMGGLAGWLGGMVLERIDSGILYPVAGLLVLLIGLNVIFRPPAVCRRPSGAAAHMAVLGLATSLMPCMPLMAVLLMAASSGSPLTGAVLALTFGIGTAASPLYYLGGATGWLATKIRNEIPRHARTLRRLSGLILALFGLRLLASWLLA